MPEISVKIIWNKPKDKDWLNQDNIALALSAYCPNTNFEVSEDISINKKWAVYTHAQELVLW